MSGDQMTLMELIENEESPTDVKVPESYLPPIVMLANSLLSCFIQKNNVVGLKLVIYLAGVIPKIEFNEDNQVILDVANICKIFNIERKELSRNLPKIATINFTYKNMEGLKGETTPFHSYEYRDKNKKIMIEVSSKAKEIIQELGNEKYSYSLARAHNLMQLKNKHSVKMQMLLEQMNNFGANIAKRRHLVLKEFNLLFGTKYTRYVDIERKILLHIKKELDKNSSLSFVYQAQEEKKGTGRPKISHITIDLIDTKTINRKEYSEEIG